MRLALDIGGTLVKCACVTDDGAITRAGEFPTDPNLGTTEFAHRLMTGAREFLAHGKEEINMVGAGMAGFADGKHGVILESPNLPGIRDLELARSLKDEFGVTAYAENDATAAAWGEYLFGGHGDVKDMLVVTLGTGIGGGLVLGGRLHRGALGVAGEIGQMVLDQTGPDCPCGGKGCLERYVGRAALEEDFRVRSGLTERVEPKIIHKRALESDPAAKDAWNAYGNRLGVVFASVANLLDLGAIILTGGIFGAWDNFSPALMSTFKRHLITPHKDRLPVSRSTLEGRAGLLGAAFLDRAAQAER